jgi:23S rRNA pseudouridine2605 synthase
METERLQKVLARAGYGSRRACETLIAEGRVTVNGKRAILGQKIDSRTDKVRVDGKAVGGAEDLIYIVMNKPRGVLSSSQSQGGKPTVIDMVNLPGRVYPVGRLDMESEGLLLLTNDGDLTYRLTHPKFGLEKVYRLLLNREPDDGQLNAWRRGVVLRDGSRTMPARVKVGRAAKDGHWIQVTLREGKKRQLRETARSLGLNVRKLIRVRMGTLRLGKLRPGAWRHLSASEVMQLKKATSGKPLRPGDGLQ